MSIGGLVGPPARAAEATRPIPVDSLSTRGVAPGDSIRFAVTDTAGIVTIPADTTTRVPLTPEQRRARAETLKRAADPRLRPWADRPMWVMLRSLAVPGWGQLHNRAWFKAIGVAGGEAALGLGILSDNRDLDRLARQVDEADQAGDLALRDQLVTRYNGVRDESIRRGWLLGGLVAYALLDAYVDAHFLDVKLEFERDPALPEGVTPPKKNLQVGLRWSF